MNNTEIGLALLGLAIGLLACNNIIQAFRIRKLEERVNDLWRVD